MSIQPLPFGRPAFSERALVAGSLVGVRAWNVNHEGEATGIFAQIPWQPGRNEAICAIGMLIGQRVIGPLGRLADLAAGPKPHGVATLGCTCGFYAFFDPSHIHGKTDGNELLGIIRGTGVATVGPHGFRVERAEILAFVEPSKRRPGRNVPTLRVAPRESRWARFCHRLHHRPWLGRIAASMPLLALPGILMLDSAWFLLLTLTGLGLSLAQLHGAHVHRKVTRERITVGLMDFIESTHLTDDKLAKVKVRYPGVPWFPTLADAIEAFPLSQPPAPPVTDDPEPLEGGASA